MKARLWTDGGARGNPGPAGYAYVEAEDGTVGARDGRVAFTHVRREHNELADRLVNEALDAERA